MIVEMKDRKELFMFLATNRIFLKELSSDEIKYLYFLFKDIRRKKIFLEGS